MFWQNFILWTCKDRELQNEGIISAELVSSSTFESDTEDLKVIEMEEL